MNKSGKEKASKQSSISLKSRHLDGLDPPLPANNLVLFPRERRGTLTWFHPDRPRKPAPLTEAEQTELTLSDRIKRIQSSVARINNLMAELKQGDTLNDTRNSGNTHRPS
jgi:hypothetical protein